MVSKNGILRVILPNATHHIHLLHLILLFFLFPLGARAYILANLYMGYGSSQYSCAAQDPSGLMWIGSNRGLFFYDGFKAWPFVLDGNYIHSLTYMGRNQLCVTDERGAHLIDVVSKKRVSSSLDKADLGRCRVSCTVNGMLWIGSEKKGLVAYNHATGQWRSVKIDIGECYALARAGNVLYAGGTNGMGCYDNKSGKWRRIHLPSDHQGMVGSLLWDDRRNALWVGLWRELYRYTPTGKHFKKELSFESSFKSMTVDANGHLLIGTDNGLLQFVPESSATTIYTHDTRNPQTISNDVILSVFQDRTHNIWVGTNNGITLMQYTPFYHYMPIQTLTVGSVQTAGFGNCFTCFLVDRSGCTWMGGTNGLMMTSPEGNTRWFRKESKDSYLPNNYIRHIYEDRQGILWLATDEGVLHYDRARRAFVPHRITDLTGRYNAVWIYQLYEDPAGRLWIATFGRGLYIADKRKLLDSGRRMLRVPTIAQLSPRAGQCIPNHAYTLIEGGGSNLWVGHQQGLSVVNTATLQGHTVGVCDDTGRRAHTYISNLTKGGGHSLWYSYRNAVCRFDMHTGCSQVVFRLPQKDDFIRGMAYHDQRLWILVTNMLVVLDTHTMKYRELWLPINQYQSIYYDAGRRRFLLGAADALMTVSPDVLRGSLSQRRVQVVSIVAQGRRLVEGEDYRTRSRDGHTLYSFPPTLSDLSFEVSDFSYANTSAANFEYRLNDGRWTPLSVGESRITFFKLAPGRYTLSIRENSSRTISTFHFEIRAPWYLSVAAFAGYVLLALAALCAFIRSLYKRNRRKYELLEREKSLELSNMKIEFFTHISHELKTPLSLIIAPLKQILSENPSKDMALRLQPVYKNALRLHSLIRSVLDFKRMEETEQTGLTLSTIDLVGMVKAATVSFEEEAGRRRITLHTDAGTGPLWIEADAGKIESIVYNLLSNAVKFVPDGTGRIEVTLSMDSTQGMAMLRVADNGPGIVPEEQPLVWTRRYHNTAGGRNPEGSGIGLYLVKRFVQLHGGRIKLESTTGAGSVFTVWLPPCTPHTAGAAQEHADKAADDGKKETVLVIDDSREMVEFLISVLSTRYRCLSAANGREGLESALTHRPQLVVVDEMMPMMTGLEFCRQLRKHIHMAHTPIIMLTAKDDAATEIESMKVGADAFVAKPFDITKLKTRIGQLLKSRRMQQENEAVGTLVESAAAVEEGIEGNDEKLVRKAIGIIEDRLGDSSFNVAALCTRIGIGEKRLQRLVKQQTGLSPVAFIRSIRIKRAAALLRTGKFSVSETMYMVGFSHASYFSKCFIEQFHVSPREYMEEHKAD